MGKDKALLPFLGTPLIQRLRDRFLELDCEIHVITNRPANYQFLDLPLHRDSIPDRGALGGLLTALEIAGTSYVGVVAADMPFASPTLLDYLRDQIQTTGADAVLPSSDHGPEPLHGVYNRSTCLPLVQEAVHNDRWRIVAWHDQAEIQTLTPEETSQAAGTAFTFTNLNTPEDFAAAEKLALKLNLI